MSQRNIINSNFWQIANADANTGNITGIKTANFSANGAQVNLGAVGNIRISGGQLGNVLTTNGNGFVYWGPGGGGGGGGGANIQPALEFTVIANGVNQSFTDTAIFNLSSNAIAPVYVNGVLLLVSDFEINGDTLTIFGDLNTGDVVTAASTTVAVVTPQTAIAAGNSSIVITPNAQITMSSNGVSNIVSIANNTLSTTNFQVSNRANLGPVGNITITGGASGQVLTTDGAGNLSWSAGGGGGGSLANGTSNIEINTSNITFNLAGNTITTVDANGQTTTGNILVSGRIAANGNIQGNVVTANTANIAGNITANHVTANSVVTANVTSNANIVFTSNSNSTFTVTDVNVIVTGNVVTSGTTTSNVAFANTTTTYGNTSTGNLTINAGGTINTPAIASGTSNIRMPSGGNVSISSGGNANVLVVSPTGITVTGNTTLGNANTVSIGGGTTGQYLKTDGNGNLSWGSISGSGTLANGNSSVDVLDNVVNITANSTANVLKINGNGIVVTGESNLGSVTGVIITGGSSGQVLRTSGTGALSWVDISRLASGNSNIELVANGNVSVSSTGVANVLVVTGTGANIEGTANITGNLSAANVTANVVTANTLSGNLARIASGNSSVTVTANSSINFTSAGNTNILRVTGTGANIAGTANITGDTAIGGNLKITGNINSSLIPDTNITYDLGNTTYRWRDLYLANNTIYIGNATIKSYDTTVLVKGLSITANGSIDSANIPANGSMFIESNLAVGNVLNANVANIGSLNANSITVTGNIDISTIKNGNSNVVVSANGNVTTYIEGNANARFTVTNTGANIAGTLQVSGKSNLGPVGNVTITGGINGLFLKTDGNGNLSWASTINSSILSGNTSIIAIANGNIRMSVSGNSDIMIATGTGVNVSGTLQVSGKSDLGAESNVIITGGSNGQYLRTDGAGNLTWAPIVSGATSLSNGNVELKLLSNANIDSMVFQTTIGGNVDTLVNAFSITRTAANINTTSLVVTGSMSVGGSIGTSGSVNASSGTMTANSIVANTMTLRGNLFNGNAYIRMSNVGDGNIALGTTAGANSIVITPTLITVSSANANFSGNLNITGASNLRVGGNVTISNNLSVTGNTTLTGLVTMSSITAASYSGTPTVKVSSTVLVYASMDAGNFRIYNPAGQFQPEFTSLSGGRTILGSATSINANGLAKTQLFSRFLTTSTNVALMDSSNCDMNAIGASIVVDFVDTNLNQAFNFTAIVVNNSTTANVGFTMMTLTRIA